MGERDGKAKNLEIEGIVETDKFLHQIQISIQYGKSIVQEISTDWSTVA